MAITGARGHVGRLVFGAMAAEALFAAVRLRLADHLGDGQHDVADLAASVGADAVSLTRLLRALAALGLMAEPAPTQFHLTETGALLRTDHPQSMASIVRMFGDPVMLAGWRDLDTAVRTGLPTFDNVYGTGFFEYLASDPALCQQFNSAMGQGTAVAAPLIVSHYDFARFGTIADMGGGDGTLLAAVLRAHLNLRGILFDSAEGLDGAEHVLRDAGVAQRCATRIGDFRDHAPEGADLYLFKSVLQDWGDDDVSRMLAGVRRVIPDWGRLVIIDPMLPDRVNATLPATMYLGDLNMLVNTGGRHRTRAEFETLCRQAGFAITTASQLPPPVLLSILDANPVTG